MHARNGYPAGVPCWVDVVQPDLDSTMAFYRELFGWTFESRTPEGAPARYAYAHLDGFLVAGMGELGGDVGPAGWTTHIWVDSADESASLVEAHGGKVLASPVHVPNAGRAAVCADPFGAVFGLWQAAENRGAQLVNAPGSWNFSDLNGVDLRTAQEFYGAVFGWQASPLELGPDHKAWMWRVAGYGELLAASDPEIREWQQAEQVPEGFADAVAMMNPVTDGAHGAAPYWGVTFGVADADAAFARAIGLGAEEVVPLFDTEYTRMGAVEDPQGAVLTLSQYRPPEPS